MVLFLDFDFFILMFVFFFVLYLKYVILIGCCIWLEDVIELLVGEISIFFV